MKRSYWILDGADERLREVAIGIATSPKSADDYAFDGYERVSRKDAAKAFSQVTRGPAGPVPTHVSVTLDWRNLNNDDAAKELRP